MEVKTWTCGFYFGGDTIDYIQWSSVDLPGDKAALKIPSHCHDWETDIPWDWSPVQHFWSKLWNIFRILTVATDELQSWNPSTPRLPLPGSLIVLLLSYNTWVFERQLWLISSFWNHLSNFPIFSSSNCYWSKSLWPLRPANRVSSITPGLQFMILVSYTYWDLIISSGAAVHYFFPFLINQRVSLNNHLKINPTILMSC